MAGLVKAATEAIAKGAPLFNGGDSAGCAAVYTLAVSSAAADPGLGQVGRDVCRVGLDRAASVLSATVPTHGRASWMLRFVLDFLVDTEGGTKNVPQPTQLDLAGDPDAAAAFRAIDDRVMGGSSSSRMEAKTGYASFCGDLVLAGGGFASVRADSKRASGGGTTAYFFGGSPGIAVEARGDGHLYKLVVRDADAGGPDGVSYQAEFMPGTPVAGHFETVILPWGGFKASWRGRPIPDAPPINPVRIGSVGFMISRIYDDGRANAAVNSGPFQLDVRSIRGAPLPARF